MICMFYYYLKCFKTMSKRLFGRVFIFIIQYFIFILTFLVPAANQFITRICFVRHRQRSLTFSFGCNL